MAGHRVVVSSFAASPLEAIESHLTLEPMEALAASALEPGDVLVEVKSANVGWVDLLTT